MGPGAGHRLERSREHSLLGGPPDLGEVADHRGLIGAAAHRLPEDHRFVHTTAVEVGADRALELVDESMHLIIRRRPVERALLVLDVAVKRRDWRIDQLDHVNSVQGRPSPAAVAYDSATRRLGERAPMRSCA